MKRQNAVMLSGTIRDHQEYSDREPYGLLTILQTDHVRYGGRHRVLFPEWLGTLTKRYIDCAEGPLEVSIAGWLYSDIGVLELRAGVQQRLDELREEPALRWVCSQLREARGALMIADSATYHVSTPVHDAVKAEPL